MEKEETEFEEQIQAHDMLKGNLETLLQSSIVYSRAIDLLDGLTEMEDMDNFEGAPHVRLIEEINTDFKNLDLSGISTGLKAADDVKKLRRDISRRIHAIMIRVKKNNSSTSKSTSKDSGESRIRRGHDLTRVELPTFHGDPLEWRGFWGLFQAILDRDPHLTDTERLFHLCSAIKCKEGGSFRT